MRVVRKGYARRRQVPYIADGAINHRRLERCAFWVSGQEEKPAGIGASGVMMEPKGSGQRLNAIPPRGVGSVLRLVVCRSPWPGQGDHQPVFWMVRRMGVGGIDDPRPTAPSHGGFDLGERPGAVVQIEDGHSNFVGL
jgi:hypothetical protein